MSDLEQLGIERFKTASEMSLSYYGQPLVITDSGGKDSAVCKELARRAGIPFELMHNHTTADAPETVRFVRSEAKRFEELGHAYIINMPGQNMKNRDKKKVAAVGWLPFWWGNRFNKRLASKRVRQKARRAEDGK